MAMKLTASEKKADTILRQYNKQIEQAYRKLGYNHTVTKNLVNQARSIFGVDAFKDMKITSGYSVNQIDRATGEIYAIPQIKRNRTTLANLDKAKALQSATQYTKAQEKGMYKRMFDVSKAYNKAIEKANQHVRQNIPQDYYKIPDIKKRTKQISDYVKKHTDDKEIRRQLLIDDLASEIFENYNSADESESPEYVQNMRDFANDYHAGKDFDLAQLEQLAQQRQNYLANVDDTITENYDFNFDDFITILGTDTSVF